MKIVPAILLGDGRIWTRTYYDG